MQQAFDSTEGQPGTLYQRSNVNNVGWSNWQRYALQGGDSTIPFDVAPATASTHAVQFAQVFGIGQTVQSVIGSRAFGTTYTNSTSKPIFVSVSAQSTSGIGTIQVVINGQSINGSTAPQTSSTSSVTFVVPPGGTYSAAPFSGNSLTLSLWVEMR